MGFCGDAITVNEAASVWLGSKGICVPSDNVNID